MAIENSRGVRRTIRRTLDEPGAASDQLPVLLEALDHEEQTVRIGAAWALCAAAAANPELRDPLESRLRRRSDATAGLAAEWIERALGEEGSEGSPDGSPRQAGDSGAESGDATDEPAAAAAAERPSEPADAESNATDDASTTHPEPANRPDAARSEDASADTDDPDAEPGDTEADTDRSQRSRQEPAGVDAVVENGNFTIPLDRTRLDALQVVDRVATDRHSWTYQGMAQINARREAVLVRTFRPPRGARLASFASAFEDVVEGWSGIDDHEHVLSVYEFGRRPHPWVVTEYAVTTLREQGRLPIRTALQVGLDAAKALGHAHERGITHRSLDPRSLALVDRNGQAEGRLLNFGLVDAFRAVDGPLPLDSRYAAPELFSDDHGAVDYLTDVYALGAILYTAFTGQPPYEESLVSRGGPAGLSYDPPSAVAADVPVAADRIVAKAMATHKIARYESADELARDLQSALAEVDGSA